MNFWNAFPFVRLSVFLILGILVRGYSERTFEGLLFVLGVILLIYLVVYSISQRIGFRKLRLISGIPGLGFYFVLGFYVTQLSYPISPSLYSGSIEGYAGTIISPLNERANYYRYELKVDEVQIDGKSEESSERIIFYVRKDSSEGATLAYGDHVLIKGGFLRIPAPSNPNEFNYQQYMQRQGIRYQSFVSSTDIKKVGYSASGDLPALFYRIRSAGIKIIENNLVGSREKGLAKALLLGVKDHLDNEIKESYAAAGAMHVLAVSGLHVGIIYLILSNVFSGLILLGKYGKFSFAFLAVGCIWGYALVTGFSPSVLRAAVMFSVITIGKSINRENHIYNCLGIAAFGLLLYDPYLIYSVGFQLSFVAVFGIVYIQPRIYHLLTINKSLLDKAWAITCVSIAAQLATFPLSVHYFHQFPTYFIISNLFVIPGAFIFLCLGVPMLVLDSIFHPLGIMIGELLFIGMWLVNEGIMIISSLPISIIDWLYLGAMEVFLIYFFFLAIASAFHFRSFPLLAFSGIFIMSILGLRVWKYEGERSKEEIIFYDINNNIVIDHIKAHHVKLYIKHNPKASVSSFSIDPYRLANALPPFQSTLDEGVPIKSEREIIPLSIATYNVLVLDTTTFHLHFKEDINADIIYIENESVKNLTWLKEKFKPEMLIFGYGNRFRYREKMKTQADSLGLKSHFIQEEGYFRIKINHNKERASLFTTRPG